MKLSRLALAVALTPGLALSATDETASHELPPLVITRATPIAQTTPASVQVIDRQQIDDTAATSLLDLLRAQAGMQIRDTMGDGNRAVISLRGFGENATNNTLVLVDGRRLNQPTLAGPALNSVPLANIERIEIVRGAGTVLYGDQAVGGVINIVTRAPLENEAYLETSRGSHDLEAYRGHVSQQLGAGFSLFASGETRNADNYRDHNNGNYSNAFARLRYDHASGHALYEYQSIDDELLHPDSLTLAQRREDRKQSLSTAWNDSKTQVHRFALEQALGSTWTANLDYSHSDQDSVGSFAAPGRYSQDTRTESVSPRLTGRFDTPLGASTLLLGHDYIVGDYQTSWGADFKQTLKDWYGQYSQQLAEDLTLTLGYRSSKAEDRDHSAARSNDDREGSSSLGLSWQADANTRMFIKREDVLRWANVDENGFVLPDVTFLKPQTGISWETGIEWRDNVQSYQATLYRLDLEDELMYDAAIANPRPWDAFATGANINLDKTRRDGLLLEARRQLNDKLIIGGQYTFTDSEYRAGSFEGNEVPWVSRHGASAYLHYEILPGLKGYLEAVHTGARYLSSDDAPQLPREGGYTLFNAALSYEHQGFVSKLRINNLTGKRYDSFALYSQWNPGNKSIYPGTEEDVQLSVGYRF
ncbi:TonB-dependent receptor [Pseudomonas sp. PDM14]|uniref:TonB-dependent receptor n=1 Tax=Pseudomonas sp. PDM14 TaxID=2769288 RepID=UPI001780A70E|nr:TonB-dependent receptor [Pseudomonas sp. PDM14]MBD9485280.1 TonB-dependent receptor [Pseudomonas sp. PDM14]